MDLGHILVLRICSWNWIASFIKKTESLVQSWWPTCRGPRTAGSSLSHARVFASHPPVPHLRPGCGGGRPGTLLFLANGSLVEDVWLFITYHHLISTYISKTTERTYCRIANHQPISPNQLLTDFFWNIHAQPRWGSYDHFETTN